MLITLALTHNQRNTRVNYEITFSPTQLGRALFDPCQPCLIGTAQCRASSADARSRGIDRFDRFCDVAVQQRAAGVGDNPAYCVCATNV